MTVPPKTIEETQTLLASEDYVCGRALATVTYLALTLGKPLFLEGEPGTGKTEIAKALSAGLGRRLIRLQCYEGLDAASAVYEWNFAAQMIAIRTAEAAGGADQDALTANLFSERYLTERPLLAAMRPQAGGRAGPADRRARPHRRTLRGVSPRSAFGFSGDDPRTWRGEGAGAANRHHHFEPHPRSA